MNGEWKPAKERDATVDCIGLSWLRNQVVEMGCPVANTKKGKFANTANIVADIVKSVHTRCPKNV